MSVSIELIEERPGLPEVVLRYRGARARLSLQGAHITDYSPADQDNLLWVSRTARFEPGTAIRGGIPLCWPWFGADPDGRGRPQHGFARTRHFEVISQQAHARHAAVILTLNAASAFPEWDGAARLELEVRLSDHLWMELRTTNQSKREVPVGVGLHSYFRVSDCHKVRIPALTGLAYLDKTAGFERREQTEPLRIEGEVDRVYLDPPSTAELLDPEHAAAIRIEAWGNSDLVVWNPGPTVARSLPDFDDQGYLTMVCIEPALALANRRLLAPGESFAVGQTLRSHHPMDPDRPADGV